VLARARLLIKPQISEMPVVKSDRLLDTKDYQKGIRISDAQIKQLSLEKAPTLAKWNYTISPR
jgi:hypothetical protein